MQIFTDLYRKEKFQNVFNTTSYYVKYKRDKRRGSRQGKRLPLSTQKQLKILLERASAQFRTTGTIIRIIVTFRETVTRRRKVTSPQCVFIIPLVKRTATVFTWGLPSVQCCWLYKPIRRRETIRKIYYYCFFQHYTSLAI